MYTQWLVAISEIGPCKLASCRSRSPFWSLCDYISGWRKNKNTYEIDYRVSRDTENETPAKLLRFSNCFTCVLPNHMILTARHFVFSVGLVGRDCALTTFSTKSMASDSLWLMFRRPPPVCLLQALRGEGRGHLSIWRGESEATRLVKMTANTQAIEVSPLCESRLFVLRRRRPPHTQKYSSTDKCIRYHCKNILHIIRSH